MHEHPSWVEGYARTRYRRLLREAEAERSRPRREPHLRSRLAAGLRSLADRLEAPTSGRLA